MPTSSIPLTPHPRPTPSAPLPLWARAGEHCAATLTFPLAPWRAAHPDGACAALFARPDGAAYPLPVAQDGDTARVTLTRDETAYPGTARLELRWLCEGSVVKSDVFRGRIAPSLAATHDAPPPPDALAQLEALLTRAQQAAESARQAASRAEKSAEEARQAAQETPLPAPCPCGQPRLTPAEARPASAWRFRRQGDAAYQPVTLPHSANADDAQTVSLWRGTAEYLAELPISRDELRAHYVLRLDGAAQRSVACVNGAPVGGSLAGYSPYAVEVTPYLHAGTNQLTVVCDNQPDVSRIPLSADFNFCNGLHGGATLYAFGDVYLDPSANGADRFHARQRDVSAESATLELSTLIRNRAEQPAEGLSLRATVRDAAHQPVQSETVPLSLLADDTPATVTLTLPRPHLWHGTRDPYLYTVTLELLHDSTVLDAAETRAGIHSFHATRDGGFFLNGESYPLRGAAMHQDHPDGALAMRDADIDESLAIAAEMGCTFLRLSHYPHREHTLRRCDELGIVVAAEIPWVNHCGAKADDAYFDSISQSLDAMILNQRNHASVHFWGLSNELGNSHFKNAYGNYTDPQGGIDWTKAGEWHQRLIARARALDDSRLIGFAALDYAKSEVISTWGADYISFNVYKGWYGGALREFGYVLNNKWNQLPDQLLAVSEYGAGGNPATHSDDPTATTNTGTGGARHDEEFQNLFHESYLEQILARPYLLFTSVWALFDFAVSGRSEGGVPYINDKGLVTRDRRIRKDAYYLYKAAWRKDIPVVYLTSRRFARRDAGAIPVKAYANTDSLTLLVDGEVKQTLAAPTRAGVVWEFAPVTLGAGSHTISLRGARGNVTATDSAEWLMLGEPPLPAPTVRITEQPQNATFTEGSVSGSLRVAATTSNGATLRYQWYRREGAASSPAESIYGATSATFPLPADLALGVHYFYCIVTATNATGTATATSDAAAVTVEAAPLAAPTVSITEHPQPLTVTEGSVAGELHVTATASDGATLSYQWYSLSADSDPDGTPVMEATTPTLHLPATLPVGVHHFYCTVTATNALGSATATSDPAAVTVVAAPPATPKVSITGHPQHATVTEGSITGELHVTATATNDATLSYQWYHHEANCFPAEPLADATAASLPLPAELAYGVHLFYCIVTATNAAGTAAATSDEADVLVDSATPALPLLVITEQPQSATFDEGSVSGVLRIAARTTPDATLSYEWHHTIPCDNAMSIGVPVENPRSTTITLPSDLASGEHHFYCVVTATNDTGTVNRYSSHAIIRVKALGVPAPTVSITEHPQPATVTSGRVTGGLSVTATASEGAKLSYQWYISDTDDTTAGKPFGMSAATIVLPESTKEIYLYGVYYFYCVVTATNDGGSASATSHTAAVTYLSDAPTVTLSEAPAPVTVNEGSVSERIYAGRQSVFLPNKYISYDVSYQWYESPSESATDGVPVDGATSSTLSLPADLKRGVHYFYCIATTTSVCGTSTSTGKTGVVTVTAPALAKYHLLGDPNTPLPATLPDITGNGHTLTLTGDPVYAKSGYAQFSNGKLATLPALNLRGASRAHLHLKACTPSGITAQNRLVVLTGGKSLALLFNTPAAAQGYRNMTLKAEPISGAAYYLGAHTFRNRDGEEVLVNMINYRTLVLDLILDADEVTATLSMATTLSPSESDIVTQTHTFACPGALAMLSSGTIVAANRPDGARSLGENAELMELWVAPLEGA